MKSPKKSVPSKAKVVVQVARVAPAAGLRVTTGLKAGDAYMHNPKARTTD